MKNFIVDIGYKRIFVRAKNEEIAHEYVSKEFPDIDSPPFLGWCTNEVANTISYETYFVDAAPLTIESFYKWAVENHCEDYALFACDSNKGIDYHDRFTLNDLTFYRDDREIFIF